MIKTKNIMLVKSHLSFNNNLPSTRPVTSNEVNLTLKSFDTKKVFDTDKMPTKLVILASNFLSTPLAIVIN